MALSIQAQLKKVLAPFAKAVGVDIKKLKDSKQDKLKAGDNIQITKDGTISATGAGEAADLSSYSTTEQVTTLIDGKVAGLVKADALDTKLANYATNAAVLTQLEGYAKTTEVQPKLTTGEGVAISESGVISATVAAPDLTGYVKTEALETALDLGDLNLVAEYEAGKTGVEPAAASTTETAAQPAATGTPAPAEAPQA